jgi:hypothetical protein
MIRGMINMIEPLSGVVSRNILLRQAGFAEIIHLTGDFVILQGAPVLPDFAGFFHITEGPEHNTILSHQGGHFIWPFFYQAIHYFLLNISNGSKLNQ